MEPHRKLKEVLLDPDSTATALLAVALDRFPNKDPQTGKRASSVTDWDPETVQMEMASEFGITVRPANFNKLMGAIEIITTDRFYKSLHDFIRLCNVLTHGTLNVRTFDPADVEEIAWGITEALLLDPPEHDDEEPFTQEILQYIGAALKREGIMTPPDILRLGVHDASALAQIQASFSDDPEMFNAIYKIEQDKTKDVDDMVRNRLRDMLGQLRALPLTNGNADDAVQRMLGSLQTANQKGKQLQPTLGG